MVKSRYAAMIKVKNGLSKQGQCLFDWSRLQPLQYIHLILQSNMSKFQKIKGHEIPLPVPKITKNQSN